MYLEPLNNTPFVYLRPLSQATVTTVAVGPSSLASSIAASTFIPVDVLFARQTLTYNAGLASGTLRASWLPPTPQAISSDASGCSGNSEA